MNSVSASSPSSWSSLASPPPRLLRRRTSSSSSPAGLSNFPLHRRPPPRGSCRMVCSGAGGGGSSLSGPQFAAKDLKFVLHDALDSGGIDTTFAREGRQSFLALIEKMSDIERETSISINRFVDLGKAALCIAAEDDALISHSSVPLPVDAFRDRLDDLLMGYVSSYSLSLRSSPERFLDSLERYLYIKKGFRRNDNPLEPRALYLHSVLTHRSGSAALLSLIYSEILKMLRLWGLLEFDCEIFFPHDVHGLPRGYHKQKSKESDQPHIMTSQILLEEILRNLKEAFWPFQSEQTKSLFLKAADAANCIDRSNTMDESGFQLASAKAAHHRLHRGVWTSVHFGDMRRALSACERLILLNSDSDELRDYSVILYHCGFYAQSLQYLKLYQNAKRSSAKWKSPSKLSILEEDAVEKLMIRLDLISMEEGWSKPSHFRNLLGDNSEPW